MGTMGNICGVGRWELEFGLGVEKMWSLRRAMGTREGFGLLHLLSGGVLSRSLLVARLGPPTVDVSSGSHVAISVSITGFSCRNEIPSHMTENYL